MNTYSKHITLTVCSALLCSCAEMSDGTRTRTEGAVTGGAIGTGVGALMGVLLGGNSESTVAGALIGGVFGGAGGYAYGDSVAEKKAAYKEAEETYRKNIAVLDHNISVAQQRINEIKQKNIMLALQNKRLSRNEYNEIATIVNKDISIFRQDANFAYQQAQNIGDQGQKDTYISRYNSLTKQADTLQTQINTLSMYSY